MAENGVTTLARRVNLCKLTSGVIATMPKIASIAFGDGGVDGDGEPIPPNEAQTGLRHQIAIYPIESVSYPTAVTARYSATIPAGDLGGFKISEAALVDEMGVVCGIKTMYVKQKDRDAEFTFSMDDEF